MKLIIAFLTLLILLIIFIIKLITNKKIKLSLFKVHIRKYFYYDNGIQNRDDSENVNANIQIDCLLKEKHLFLLKFELTKKM